MATTITINGSVTLDESSGLQNSGIPNPVSGEDNNDSDVSLSTLQSTVAAFYNRLFNNGANGGLGLSTTFATNNGVAASASNFITVSGGTVASLGSVPDDGSALTVYAGVATGGVATTLSAVNGGTISLVPDATLGNRMVLGVDANNDIVFAIFMDPNATLTSARVWTVQFEAISNPVATNPDDPVDLTGFIDVGATTSLNFTFDQLHSGSNLFGTVGDAANALNVIAQHPKLKADGTLDTAGQVIKTSQGGTGATIGVDSQMFDPGEGAYFTYINTPNTDFLGANLSQTEADNSADIQYTGGTNPAMGGSTTISQIQGNALATMRITAYDISDAPQGTTFVNNIIDGTGIGAPVAITSVHVFDAAGNDVTSGKVSISGGVATVSGLDSGFRIAWTTNAPHDRVLIEGVAGKFDIGAFSITQANTAHSDVGSQLRFEDDGPTITATATGAPTLTVDETFLATNATASFAAQFTASFGTDGPAAASSVTYALSTPGGASGLTDTATGQSVVLSLNASGQVVGKTAVSGDTVFVVSVNASGQVTLDQQRAVVHANPNDPDESRGLTGSNLVVLTATATDGDADHAAAPLDLTPLLVFKDDGPSIGPVADSTVDFTTGGTGTATKSLVGAVGADPNNAPYTIVGTSAVGSFPDISINGTTLRPALSNNNETLTYNAAGTDGTFGTADDVPFYRLTLSETGAGSYTFTVLVNPPPVKLTFDLSTLASGQNLWGAAADTSKAEGFEVFANNVTLKADGTQASGGTVNTSQGGGPTTIGISNQMFDPGEGAFFTYVTNPTTGGSKDADNINYNGLFQATEAQAAISQTQGNTPVELTVKAFEISSPVSPDPTLGRDLISGAGSGSPVSITAVHIFNSTGQDVTNTGGRSFTINAGVADIKGLVAGDTFDWTTGSNHDQVLVSDVTGKWDIGAFNIIQTQPTPAQDLPFKVQATDGDSDFKQASFNVHINAVVA